MSCNPATTTIQCSSSLAEKCNLPHQGSPTAFNFLLLYSWELDAVLKRDNPDYRMERRLYKQSLAMLQKSWA
ncbi:hypothetical protein RIF29_37772 [Crotalaria pallida]|uniref:Uncharacterized protein n=1 Tax=Crotalaria pallida TaxID=3830 RepID=A0AAN9DYS1_CROPI